MEAGVLPARNGGQKGLYAWEPHRALLGFILGTSDLWPVRIIGDNLGLELASEVSPLWERADL